VDLRMLLRAVGGTSRRHDLTHNQRMGEFLANDALVH